MAAPVCHPIGALVPLVGPAQAVEQVLNNNFTSIYMHKYKINVL